MVSLGDRVVDSISGFSGIVVGRADYLFGCIQACVAPEQKKGDKNYQESHWYDEDRLRLIKPQAYQKSQAAAKRRGGPVSNLPRTP